MTISSIRRRPGLFGLMILFAVSAAAIIAIVRTQNYTSYAEVVVGPTLPPADAEAAVAEARAWLRSDTAAQTVARSLAPWAANRLTASVIGGTPFHRRATGDTTMAVDLGGTRDALVRRLRMGVSAERIAESYALVVGFTAGDPRLAATVADRFASEIVTHSRRPSSSVAAFRVISAADPAVAEGGPAMWLVLTVGALVGIVAGAITVVIVERRFTGLTSGADVQSRLGLYHLGSVPHLRSVLRNAGSPIDAVVDAPFSGYAEAFRGILVAARQTMRPDAKVFLITSALPDEGKSTTVACLARSAALAGENIVVVDCDSRRSGVSAALAGERREPGLSELLRGECGLDDALVQDSRSGAWIIPAGNDRTDISLLLGGKELAGLLEALRTRFDRVLVDSAPVLAMATTRSIMPLVDASIMVVRWRATPDRAIRAALSAVAADYASWSGVVLTQVDMRVQGRYGSDDASAFYQQSSKYYR